MSDAASATVSCPSKVIGVSKRIWRDFIQEITSETTGSGISCGITVRPPRRATVSAIRLPEIAVIFATTNGIVAPVLSEVRRSTSIRLVTFERDGIIKTSS